MKFDSRASLLAHTFANPCLGHEPEAKVATHGMEKKVKMMFLHPTIKPN
jgi:hypothetical protein